MKIKHNFYWETNKNTKLISDAFDLVRFFWGYQFVYMLTILTGFKRKLIVKTREIIKVDNQQWIKSHVWYASLINLVDNFYMKIRTWTTTMSVVLLNNKIFTHPKNKPVVEVSVNKRHISYLVEIQISEEIFCSRSVSPRLEIQDNIFLGSLISIRLRYASLAYLHKLSEGFYYIVMKTWPPSGYRALGSHNPWYDQTKKLFTRACVEYNTFWPLISQILYISVYLSLRNIKSNFSVKVLLVWTCYFLWRSKLSLYLFESKSRVLFSRKK